MNKVIKSTILAFFSMIFFNSCIKTTKFENGNDEDLYESKVVYSKLIVKNLINQSMTMLENEGEISKSILYNKLISINTNNTIQNVNRVKDFSDNLKKICESFVIELKKNNKLINDEKFKDFFIINVKKLQNQDEKNILAEIINMASAYNNYYYIPENSLRLNKLLNSGFFNKFQSTVELYKLFPSVTVVG